MSLTRSVMVEDLFEMTRIRLGAIPKCSRTRCKHEYLKLDNPTQDFEHGRDFSLAFLARRYSFDIMVCCVACGRLEELRWFYKKEQYRKRAKEGVGN